MPLELCFWIGGLLFLFLLDVLPEQAHVQFCVFRLAGFESCPGCGLGESLSLLLHGRLQESVQAHLLGIPALGVIISRTVTLIRFHTTITTKGTNHEQIDAASS